MAEQVVPFQAEITLLQRHQWIKRRTEPRYQCGPATAGRVVGRAGGGTRSVWVLNLSAGGAGLLCDQALEDNTLLLVQIRSAARDRCYELPARVVHCTRQINGDWMVGCEFSEKLGPDDLEALL